MDLALDLTQLLINGVALGSIIALASVGLTLTYGILRLPNFAHGDFLTLGAFLTFLFNTQLFSKVVFHIPWLDAWFKGANIWFSIALATLITIASFLVCEILIWSRMRDRKATSTTLIIISIGLALFIRNAIIFIWGGGNQSYDLSVSTAMELGSGLKIPYYRLVVIGLAILAVLGLHFLLQNTKIGKAMRAVADDIDLASVSGIDVERVVLWTWVLTGGLTALSGGMYGLITAVRPNMGWFLILPMFASVVLGGIGNPYGAIAGALIIGVAQEVSTYWLPSEYKLGVALLVMVVVLLIRPQGIFKGTL
ncbi:MAG: branched-chain amino acid ABC transporter permease [Acaryochloridaceae cyanobacterium CSU_5_19]|nr:branched-chain amino acid ABC transporter permease [Acaryochloridaceae cyanobacterium CSU_5_19]